MSSSAFRLQYYQERLAFYESLDPGQLSETELIDVAGEASSLRKFLTDILVAWRSLRSWHLCDRRGRVKEGNK